MTDPTEPIVPELVDTREQIAEIYDVPVDLLSRRAEDRRVVRDFVRRGIIGAVATALGMLLIYVVASMVELARAHPLLVAGQALGLALVIGTPTAYLITRHRQDHRS